MESMEEREKRLSQMEACLERALDRFSGNLNVDQPSVTENNADKVVNKDVE